MTPFASVPRTEPVSILMTIVSAAFVGEFKTIVTIATTVARLDPERPRIAVTIREIPTADGEPIFGVIQGHSFLDDAPC
jgi:hypothetical protein